VKPKTKPCTSTTGRHTWAHRRNRIVRTQTVTTIHLAERGVYACATCAATKLGRAVYADPAPAAGPAGAAAPADTPGTEPGDPNG
jgi:hypothetical protein